MSSVQSLNDQIQSNLDKREDEMSTINISNQNQQGSVLTFKIKDSLYMGTSIQAFKDEQFILLNWIDNVIIVQTKQHQFDNMLKELYGQEQNPNQQQNDSHLESKFQEQEFIRYLHCKPQLFNQSCQVENQILPIKKNEKNTLHTNYADNFQNIYDFIQLSEENGTSSLILSASPFPKVQTTGYLFTICAAYMMKKYSWSLYKSLEYMNAKHPNASISQESLKFLNKLEILLMKSTNLTYNWDEWKNNEQLVIRNTYVNGRQSCWKQSLAKEKNKSFPKHKLQKSYSRPKKVEKKESSQIIDASLNSTQQNQIRPILKSSNTTSRQNFIQTTKKNKNKITINQQNNKVKQFYQDQHNQSCELKQEQKKFIQNLALKQDKISAQRIEKSFHSARNQRISLSVSKLVAKYRDQKSQQSKNQSLLSSKNLSSDNLPQSTNFKSLNKKKSFYNFEAFQKVKQRNSEPNQTSSNSKQNGKNKQWLQIIDKKRSFIQNSLKKSSEKQIFSKKRNNKENLLSCKDNQKQHQTKNYIKQIKKNINEGLHQRKMSINQRIQNQESSRKKDKNLIIQFEDFKQLLRKKQKSIGNLNSQNFDVFNKNEQILKKDDKIASVIQKLKKQSFQNKSSTLNLRSNYNCGKSQKKNGNKKDPQMKWR